MGHYYAPLYAMGRHYLAYSYHYNVKTGLARTVLNTKPTNLENVTISKAYIYILQYNLPTI